MTTHAPLLAHQGVVHVSHHQFNLVVDNDAPDGPDRAHANGLADPTGDRGSVQISTAMHSGDVHLSFEALAAEPTLDTDGWAEAVEISIEIRSVYELKEWTSGELRIVELFLGFAEGFPTVLNPQGTGHYRLRVHANRNPDEWEGEGDEPVDQFLIQMWLAPPAPETLYKPPFMFGMDR